MKQESNRARGQNSQSSDALADIALNSLGLVLIIMLVYILLFRETTRKVREVTKAQNVEIRSLQKFKSKNKILSQQIAELNPDRIRSIEQENASLTQKTKFLNDSVAGLSDDLADARERAENLEGDFQAQKNVLEGNAANAQRIADSLRKQMQAAKSNAADLSQRLESEEDDNETLKNQEARAKRQLAQLTQADAQLRQQIAELQAKLSRMTTGDQWSGLWKFRNQVNELVDHNGKSEVVDWTIDYFLYLKVTDGKVSGTLFGANDVEKADQSGNSQSYATINGTLSRRGELDIELTFSSGTSDNGSEHLRCKLAGETFVGKLESGKHRFGFRNYVGTTRGTKLNESAFR